MGSYANQRGDFYLNKIKFVSHNIEQKLFIDKKKLISNLNNNLKKYDTFLSKFYFFKNDSLTIENLIDKEITKFKKKIAS